MGKRSSNEASNYRAVVLFLPWHWPLQVPRPSMCLPWRLLSSPLSLMPLLYMCQRCTCSAHRWKWRFLLSYIVLKLTAFISYMKNLLHTWKPANLSLTVPFALRKGTDSFKRSWYHRCHSYFLHSQIQCRGQSHAPVYTSHNTRPLFINKCLEV